MVQLGQTVFYHSTPDEVMLGMKPVYAAIVENVENDVDFTVCLITNNGVTGAYWTTEGFGPGQSSATPAPE